MYFNYCNPYPTAFPNTLGSFIDCKLAFCTLIVLKETLSRVITIEPTIDISKRIDAKIKANLYSVNNIQPIPLK
jgi:hypothetical protein